MGRISSEQFEAQLARIERSVGGRREGLFGPESTVWRLGREAATMLGGGRAALLQAAHPFVAQAVVGQSAVMTDVQGRFKRTFENVFAMTFGSTAHAVRSARRIRHIHEHVHGTLDEDLGRFRAGDPYDALDAEATFWVAATLWDTSMKVYELLFGPVPKPQKDAYLRESLRFSSLFGLAPADLPHDWASFKRYFARMLASDTIAVGQKARELCTHILTPPRPAARPAYAWLEVFTAATLPEPIRRSFGLSLGARDRLLFEASVAALRRSVPLMPDSVRYFPAYLDARRRLAGRPGRDLVAHTLEQLVHAGLRPA